MKEQNRFPWRTPLPPPPGPDPVRRLTASTPPRSQRAADAADADSHRTRHHLHRFFEELLRRSEH